MADDDGQPYGIFEPGVLSRLTNEAILERGMETLVSDSRVQNMHMLMAPVSRHSQDH